MILKGQHGKEQRKTKSKITMPYTWFWTLGDENENPLKLDL